MNQHKATRTLVKSPPELWAECSDASSLTRHLDQFGEIRIIKLEPETAVAWEGERVSGTVRLEPSGWGTRVTLTAAVGEDPAPVGAPASTPAPAPLAGPEPEAEREPEAGREPEAEPEPEPPLAPPPAPTFAREPAPPRRRGLLARLFGFFGSPSPAPPSPSPSPAPPPPAEPESTPAIKEAAPDFPPSEGGNLEHPPVEPAAEPEGVPPTELASPTAPEPQPPLTPVVADLMDAEAALVAALESLGQAHHRPFSRA